MNFLNWAEPLAYLIVIAIGLFLTVVWIFFPIIVINRLNSLIEIGEQILAAQTDPPPRAIRVNPVIPPDNGMASCECFHCGQSISFEKANYDPDNAIIDCPSCGKKTKLFIKLPIAPAGI